MSKKKKEETEKTEKRKPVLYNASDFKDTLYKWCLLHKTEKNNNKKNPTYLGFQSTNTKEASSEIQKTQTQSEM